MKNSKLFRSCVNGEIKRILKHAEFSFLGKGSVPVWTQNASMDLGLSRGRREKTLSGLRLAKSKQYKNVICFRNHLR